MRIAIAFFSLILAVVAFDGPVGFNDKVTWGVISYCLVCMSLALFSKSVPQKTLLWLIAAALVATTGTRIYKTFQYNYAVEFHKHRMEEIRKHSDTEKRQP